MAVRFTNSSNSYSRTVSLGSVSQLSFSFWVKITASGVGGTLLSLYNSSDNNQNIEVFFDDEDILYSSFNFDTTQIQTLTVGVWYWVGVRISGTSGTTLIRALNGSSFTATGWTAAASSTTITTLEIGNGLFFSAPDADLAALKLWTGAALAQAELENEAFTTTLRSTSSIRAWYPFDQASTVDYSGMGSTLSGGAGLASVDGPGIAWRPVRRHAHKPLSVPAEVLAGPILAPWSIPEPGISLGTTAAPPPLIAPWSVPTPEIFTGSTPPTQVQPDLLVAPWSIPTPDLSVSVNIHPAPILAPWSVPAPDVSVPINPGDDLSGQGQLSFNGFKLGGGTPYRLVQLVGADIDMPALDNGNVPHPSEDGAQSGEKLALPRIIEATFKVTVPREQMRDIMEDLRQGTPKADADEELSLAIQVLDTIYVTEGAVMRRTPGTIDKRYPLGFSQAVVVQWECSDPRLYSRALRNATIADGTTVDVFHAGNTSTKPLLRFPGPAIKPRLEIERTLGDGGTDLRVIEFDVDLDSGETLIVDVRQLTATVAGVSVMNALTGASVAVKDWVLGRGDSSISYETTGTAPPALVFWRDAWI